MGLMECKFLMKKIVVSFIMLSMNRSYFDTKFLTEFYSVRAACKNFLKKLKWISNPLALSARAYPAKPWQSRKSECIEGGRRRSFVNNKVLSMLFFILFFTPICHPEGFSLGTVVHTSYGPVPIRFLFSRFYGILSPSLSGPAYEIGLILREEFEVIPVVVIITVGTSTLTVPPNQRFYVPASGLWVKAENLTVGEQLLAISGAHLPILSVQTVRQATPVKRILVHPLRMFAVGPDGIVVHNFADIIFNGA
jgi:hypothetical protein